MGDEHRHPPERGLLVRYLAKVGLRLGVRDRGRDQLGQARDAPFASGREPFRPWRRGDGDAPQAALESDRRADGGPQA
jgi:hypothetical protein